MRFKKRPVIIDAIQWTGKNTQEILSFADLDGRHDYSDHPDCFLIIPTLEGNHRASINDWIIKGVEGEFYPCKPDIFEKTYKKVGRTDER